MPEWMWGVLGACSSIGPILMFIETRKQLRISNAKIQASWHGDMSKDDGVVPDRGYNAENLHKSMETSRAIARRAGSHLVDGQKLWGIVSNFNKQEADYLFDTLLCAYDELGYKPLSDSLHQSFLKHFDDGAVIDEPKRD